jgi:DNA gyrase subunit A
VMRLGENDKVMVLARTDHDDEAQTEQIDASEAEAEPTAEQLAEMEAADAAAEAEAPEAEEKTEE